MSQRAPARVGDDATEIDTPALIIDLEVLERNITRMRDLLAGSAVRLRPHAKTHKTPAIALQQVAAGAVGVCCQKVSEAEAMVEGGVRDVFVSNQVVGARKLERLGALARQAKVAVAVDDASNVAALAAAASEAQVTLDVFVEVDVGMFRCGVPAGEPAAALATIVASLPSLRFAGLHAYHGLAQHFRAVEERRQAIASASDVVRTTKAALAAAGLACPVVTGAGTGTFSFELASGVYDEVQPGSYVFMDRDYADNSWDGVPRFEQSLFCVTTVMSTPDPSRIVVDAGLKATSTDSGVPRVHDRDGLQYLGASDEHGVVAVITGDGPRLGERLLLVPGHCDPTVNLHDWLVGIRNGKVETVWPVTARGAGA